MLCKDTHFKQTYYNLKGRLPSKKTILENNSYSNNASTTISGELLFCNCLQNQFTSHGRKGSVFSYFEIPPPNSYLLQNLITKIEIT